VSAHGAGPSVTPSGAVESAAEKTVNAMHAANHMSGAVVTQHGQFAIRGAVALKAADRTDAILHANLTTATTIARTGARFLDTIAVRTNELSHAGATATFPAAQRIIMSALRAQLAEASRLVDSVRQQGDELANRVRGLHYESVVAPLALEPQVPTGPIVWCLRPQGTFGNYRCSVLYPDLRVGTYWSPSDNTGGSLP
jgi:hypothetical protein